MGDVWVWQGHQIVMLYNSGGISQIFAWLQRVMAHNDKPPSILRMRDPLELLLDAAVPTASGKIGVPDMLTFQSLAEYAQDRRTPVCEGHASNRRPCACMFVFCSF